MNSLHRQQGFTLVEVITVMLVLVALASVTVESSKDFVFQNRYDITKDRYEKIKKAIIGDSHQVINGQPNIEGFVKDVGRLPFNLRELTDGYCSDNTQYLDSINCPSGQWNPKIYLSVTDLKDGWGNTGTDNNYDWNVTFADILNNSPPINGNPAVSMNIQSKGKDDIYNNPPITDPNNLDADYPTLSNLPSIKQSDWMINVNGIQANIMASSFQGHCWIIDQTTCATPSAWNTWTASQPQGQTICQAAGGAWNDTATPPSCSGATISLCSPYTSSTSKSACELSTGNMGKWIYAPSNICIRITDSRLPPINSIPVSIQEDGREHLISFNFPVNPQYIPLGSVSISVYQYVSGGDCSASTTRYERTSGDIQLTLYPNTTLPTINW